MNKVAVVVLLVFSQTLQAAVEPDSFLFGPTATEVIRDQIAMRREKAQSVQETAIQIGKVNGSITKEAKDVRWFGDVSVMFKADYTATFGLRYSLIEKGMRIEIDAESRCYVVIVDPPEPLLPSVELASIRVDNRERSWLRTWDVQEKLQLDAQNWLDGIALESARTQCLGTNELEMTRSVVRDIVLDMVGELYTKKIKKTLADKNRVKVVFTHELNKQRWTDQPMPQTPLEIDTRRSATGSEMR